MQIPQAVLGPHTSAAIFLVLAVDPGGEAAVLEFLPELSGLVRSIGSRAPAAGLTCVTGIGAIAWDRLFTGARPAGLHPFREITGARHAAVGTPGDLFFHVRAARTDLCFELATQIAARLGSAVSVCDETQTFTYFEERDLLGFVEGTENPTGDDAVATVTVGAEDPEFAGGSYALTQKYLHDMQAWNALPVHAQEAAVGRTKLDNFELTGDRQAADSHVALNTLPGPDGEEQQILRANMPFGSPGHQEFGTYFVGYCRTPTVIEDMLHRMFVGVPAGNSDRILDFSKPVTGGLFYVPTAAFLEDPPGLM
jgi:putative iron-dependent peroxidase